jgi:ubiquinone/menaquinone biosynthesis C-methylase UbiE
LKITQQWLSEERLDADLRLQSMTEKLRYQDSCFDAILSIQVIHHAHIVMIKGIVKEVSRVLKKYGLLFITVPSTRNQGTIFEQLESNTFIPLDGSEKGIPHHFLTPEGLREVFDGFEIIDIHLDMLDHYCMFALKG